MNDARTLRLIYVRNRASYWRSHTWLTPHRPSVTRRAPVNHATQPGSPPMKVRSSLKSLKGRHRDCKVVRRKGRTYVINKTDPRFKAKQG